MDSSASSALQGCVSSLRTSMQLLESSINILDTGVNDYPRLTKVLQTTRVCRNDCLRHNKQQSHNSHSTSNSSPNPPSKPPNKPSSPPSSPNSTPSFPASKPTLIKWRAANNPFRPKQNCKKAAYPIQTKAAGKARLRDRVRLVRGLLRPLEG